MTTQDDNPAPGERYEFCIKGVLTPDWSDWLDGLEINQLENGDTVISGLLIDQAALHGVLAKIRDLNLVLISVHQTSDKPAR